MNELIRKIKYFEEFNKIKNENQCFKNYMNFIFNTTTTEYTTPKELPFLIETNDQKVADQMVFSVAKSIKKTIQFISLSEQNKFDVNDYEDKLVYIYDFHNIKNTAKDLLLKSIKGKDVILCSFEVEGNIGIEKVVVNNEDKISSPDSILTINDYVKTMVLKFQSKYPDTGLSKKLGISRKSLWEKRKKFGIEKNKK
jgi:hypothetical protein